MYVAFLEVAQKCWALLPDVNQFSIFLVSAFTVYLTVLSIDHLVVSGCLEV